MANYVTHIAEIRPEYIHNQEAKTFVDQRCTLFNDKYYFYYETPSAPQPEFMREVAEKIPQFSLFIYSEDTGYQVGEAIIKGTQNIADHINWEKDFSLEAIKKFETIHRLRIDIFNAKANRAISISDNLSDSLGFEVFLEAKVENSMHSIYLSKGNTFYARSVKRHIEGYRLEDSMLRLGEPADVANYISTLSIDEKSSIQVFPNPIFNHRGSRFNKTEFIQFVNEKLFCKELEQELKKQIPGTFIYTQSNRPHENCFSLPVEATTNVQFVLLTASDLKTEPSFRVCAYSMIDDIEYEALLEKHKTSLKAVEIARGYFSKVVADKKYNFENLPYTSQTSEQDSTLDLNPETKVNPLYQQEVHVKPNLFGVGDIVESNQHSSTTKDTKYSIHSSINI